MASGAGFVSDANNTLRNNKSIRSRRSFLNGATVEVKKKNWIAPKKSEKEKILFHKRMKVAMHDGMRKEVLMYTISLVITLIGIFLINQIIF